MSENKNDGRLISILRIVVQKIIENPDSPFVAVPLALCLVFLLVYIPAREPIILNAGIGFAVVTLAADWVGRWQNRRVKPAHFDPDTLEQEVQDYRNRALSKSEDLRKKGKVAAADTVIEKASKAIYDELARLAGEYEQVRELEPSGMTRTLRLEELVSQIQDIARRTALEEIEEVKEYFESKDAGRRIVGLAIAEERPNVAYFDRTLNIVKAPGSAFEQYHALRVIEQLTPHLSPEERKRLKAALEDQMSGGEGKWIRPKTPNRWELANRILGFT